MAKLLPRRSCGFHSIHGAFKTGDNKKEINERKKLMKALCQILHDNPARRADYTDITGNQQFPLFSVVDGRFRMKRWQLELLIFGKTYVNYTTSISHCQKASSDLVKAISLCRVICFQILSFWQKSYFLHLHHWYLF